MVASFKTNLLDWLKTKVYVKNEIDTKLQNKSDTNHTHDISELYDNFDMISGIQDELNEKADKSVVTKSVNGLMSKEDKSKLDGIATGANKTVVDSSLSSSSTNPVQNKVVNSALNGKANSSHSHSISNITNLQSALDSKSDTGHNHDERYYTETEMNTKLKSKSDTNHNHDNKYSLLTHHHTGLDGIPDIICDSAGQQSVAGYRKVFRLTITRHYFDSPVSFEFVQRTCRQTGRVHIVFNSSTSTDPSLKSFTYDGAIEMPIYLYKESAGTWVFIIQEVSSYDTVNVRFLPLSSNIKNSCTITPINEYLANLPSTNIQVGIPDLTVSTHTLANGVKLYKYGKIVLAVFNNYQYSGKKPNVWTDIFNIPSAYKPISTDNIYGHSTSGMILAGSNKISLYPSQSSGGVFGCIVWVTS